MHFYCEKLLVDRNRDRGLNRPPLWGEGAENVKCREGLKFSKGAQFSFQLAPCYSSIKSLSDTH